jgi:ABC-type ATPase with predicted acetyltransferase domain
MENRGIAIIKCLDCGETIEVVIKPHGRITRRYCELCQKVREIKGGKKGGRPRKEKL